MKLQYKITTVSFLVTCFISYLGYADMYLLDKTYPENDLIIFFAVVVAPIFLCAVTYLLCSLIALFSNVSIVRKWFMRSFWFTIPATLILIALEYILTTGPSGGDSRLGGEFLLAPSLLIFTACIIWTPIYLYRNRKR